MNVKPSLTPGYPPLNPLPTGDLREKTESGPADLKPDALPTKQVT